MLASVPCRAAFEIGVKFVNGCLDGTTIPLEIEPNDTIQKVKKKIHDKAGGNIPPKIDLMFQHQHLSQDHKHVSDYPKMKETNATIIVVTHLQTLPPADPLLGWEFRTKDKPPSARSNGLGSLPIRKTPARLVFKRQSFDIDVDATGRENFTLKVEQTDTVKQVKQKIHDHYDSSRSVYGTPDYGKTAPQPKYQKIGFDGKVWQDDELIHAWRGKPGPNGRVTINVSFTRRWLANQRLIDRFIRESIRCQQS